MNTINESQLEKIVLQAQIHCQDSQIEWIETDQLFTDLYGDIYLRIKRKFSLDKTIFQRKKPSLRA